jgi:hypothetical protein
MRRSGLRAIAAIVRILRQGRRAVSICGQTVSQRLVARSGRRRIKMGRGDRRDIFRCATPIGASRSK